MNIQGKEVPSFSDDERQCIENIHWELDALLEYLKDCNSRKITLFKVALAVFSVLTTGLVTIYSLYSKGAGKGIEEPFDILFVVVLVSMGLINFSIIKELISIHASRLITYRQMNCLRQAMDSIRYARYEGKYPEAISELRATGTAYWKAFGQHRKLPLDNAALRQSEKGLFRSPDKFMILIIASLSLVVMMSPLVYVVAYARDSFTAGLLSGTLGVFFVAVVIYEGLTAKKTLDDHLNEKTP